MFGVIITTTATTISVMSPYNTLFVAAARRAAGEWDGKAWTFDRRDEDRVRKLCMTYYGTDGLRADVVTIRVKFEPGEATSRGPLAVHGRIIAKAFGRDSGAKLGEGVVVIEGGFGSGGSVKNWTTRALSSGAVVLLRDFPREKALLMAEEIPDEVSIEPEAPLIDREALTAERERVAARLAEIDALLAEPAA